MFALHPYFFAVFLVASLPNRPGLRARIIPHEANQRSEPSSALERDCDSRAAVLLEQGEPAEVQCSYSFSVQLHQLQYMYLSSHADLLTISTLLLGIICRCPDFIQHLQSDTSFKVEDSVEIVWISVFQLCGLFISCTFHPI